MEALRKMRSVFKKSFIAGALVIAATLGSAGQAADEPANLIKYRQAIMKAVGGHMAAIVAPLTGEVSFTDEIAGHAHAINELSKNLARLFPEGSGQEAGKTRALPAIWAKWADFEANIKTLETESGKLAKVAESGDMAAIGQQVGVLGKEACTACHKAFRQKVD